jgi:hypothetical protein
MSESESKRTFFIDNLCKLVASEYEEMFRILKSNGGEWSENCNGIFFDVNRLPDDIFDKLYSFLEYCLKQRVDELLRLESMNELKKEMKEEELKPLPPISNQEFVITL